MAAETGNFPRDASIMEIASQLVHQNTILERMAIAQGADLLDVDWNEIAEIVRGGNASREFSIGDQIVDGWTAQNNVKYEFPWDVVAFGNFEKHDGSVVPGMVLQAHYCDPVAMQFSGYPALLHCPSGLAVGTYHFKCSASWGNITANTDYQFTLANAVPEGGLVCGPQNWPDVAVANWKITTYASNTATTPIETVGQSV